MNMARQGDVLIERVDAIPDGLKPVRRQNNRLILAGGESTGHAHAICKRDCEMYEDVKGNYCVKVPQMATVVHEKHAPVELLAGSYYVTRQYEWCDDDEPIKVKD
jgi:hypothetical protein